MTIEYKGITIECAKEICDELVARIPHIENKVKIVGRRAEYDKAYLGVAIDDGYVRDYGKDIIGVINEVVIKHI